MTYYLTQQWSKATSMTPVVIDQDKLSEVKSRTVSLLDVHHVIRHNDLVLLLEGFFQHINPDYIMRALSELVQDNKIKRVEFRIPDYPGYYTIYLPGGSSIV